MGTYHPASARTWEREPALILGVTDVTSDTKRSPCPVRPAQGPLGTDPPTARVALTSLHVRAAPGRLPALLPALPARALSSFPLQLQVNLLSKFLLIAKSCYEQRNFATAMQILGGLEHLAVRQSPVSPPEGQRPARAAPRWPQPGTTGHGHQHDRRLIRALLSGLENFTCEDGRGHGGAEGRGGTAALREPLAARVPGVLLNAGPARRGRGWPGRACTVPHSTRTLRDSHARVPVLPVTAPAAPGAGAQRARLAAHLAERRGGLPRGRLQQAPHRPHPSPGPAGLGAGRVLG